MHKYIAKYNSDPLVIVDEILKQYGRTPSKTRSQIIHAVMDEFSPLERILSWQRHLTSVQNAIQSILQNHLQNLWKEYGFEANPSTIDEVMKQIADWFAMLEIWGMEGSDFRQYYMLKHLEMLSLSLEGKDPEEAASMLFYSEDRVENVLLQWRRIMSLDENFPYNPESKDALLQLTEDTLSEELRKFLMANLYQRSSLSVSLLQEVLPKLGHQVGEVKSVDIEITDPLLRTQLGEKVTITLRDQLTPHGIRTELQEQLLSKIDPANRQFIQRHFDELPLLQNAKDVEPMDRVTLHDDDHWELKSRDAALLGDTMLKNDNRQAAPPAVLNNSDWKKGGIDFNKDFNVEVRQDGPEINF